MTAQGGALLTNVRPGRGSAVPLLSSSADDEMSKRMNELPKAVVSSRLREPVAWSNTLGLVDRLRLAVFPLTLGVDGREPAHLDYPRAGLRLVDSTIRDSRVVVLTYQPENAPAR